MDTRTEGARDEHRNLNWVDERELIPSSADEQLKGWKSARGVLRGY
jgi:hypothetical protein